MKVFRFYITLLLLVFAVVARAGVEVKSHLNPVSMKIGEQATLTLEVTAPKGAEVVLPPLDSLKVAGTDVMMITPGVEVLEVNSDTTEVNDNTKKITCDYILTCFDENKYVVPALMVLVDKQIYKTNSINFSVATVPVDTTNLDKFYPPKDVQEVPFLWAEWAPFFWLSVLVLVLIGLIVYLYVRLRQNKPIISRILIIKHIPAHQKALTAINSIKHDQHTEADDRKAYYTKLTDTLREYIRERFGFNAMEMTSTEIITHLQDAGDQAMIDELKELFRTADLVKFAKYNTDINEDDANLLNAITFIDQTKSDDKEHEQKVAQELTQEEKRKNSSRKNVKIAIGVLVLVVMGMVVYIGINVIKLLY